MLSLPQALPTELLLFPSMALPAFVTTLLAISSLALAAPSDSLAHRDTTPTIKSQVWAGGKTYYYRGCYDELKSTSPL